MSNGCLEVRYSIVVPAYNLENWLSATVQSVVAATRQLSGKYFVELICINDGSKDGTRRVLEREESKLGKDGILKIIVINQENKGVSIARNAGLSVASGEWVLFLDGDDLLDSDIFNVLDGHIASYDKSFEAIQYKSRKFITEDDIISSKVADIDNDVRLVDTKHHLPQHIIDVPLSWYLFKREKISDVKFRPISMGEDRLYLFEALVKIDSILLVNKRLYYYRLRDGSALRSSWTEKKIIDTIKYLSLCNYEMTRCNKVIEAGSFKRVANMLIEECAYNIMRLNGHSARVNSLICWREAVQNYNCYGCSCYTKLAYSLVKKCGFCAAILVGVIPYALKKRGLYRKRITT